MIFIGLTLGEKRPITKSILSINKQLLKYFFRPGNKSYYKYIEETVKHYALPLEHAGSVLPIKYSVILTNYLL